MMLLVAYALAAPAPSDEARLSWALRSQLARVEAGLPVFDPWAPAPDRVVIVVEADVLDTTGLEVLAVHQGRYQLSVPYQALTALAARPGVQRVRLPWRAVPKEVMSEGYDEIMAVDWHRRGLSGSGVKVGVLDVGFGNFENLDPSELPEDPIFNLDYGSPWSDSHGTAVTEVIHDFAPDATFYLASFSTDVEFCALLEWMTEEKVDVINASIGFDNVWHADGSSALTQCADAAVAAGAQFFSAAGNENTRYRVGLLTHDDDRIALAGTSELWAETNGGWAYVSFRWSEPMDAADQDLDLTLYNEDGTLCGTSQEPQAGAGYPVETISADGCSNTVQVVITGPDANLAGLEGYLYSYYGLPEDMQTHTESLTLPGDNFNGITVGSADYAAQSVSYFSSRGPTNDGRLKPDVVGPTGVTTTTIGAGQFEGTSASTPHAAGLGVLWVESTGDHNQPDKMKAWFLESATDIGPTGIDNESGAGLVSADDPPAGRCGCDSQAGNTTGLVWLAYVWARTRLRPTSSRSAP